MVNFVGNLAQTREKNKTRATAEFSFSFNCCNEMNIKMPQLKIVKDELMFTAFLSQTT
jgi:hypothetical protein